MTTDSEIRLLRERAESLYRQLRDLQQESDIFRRHRNNLKRRLRFLERRRLYDRKRIGELKSLLSKNGIDWRNSHDSQ